MSLKALQDYTFVSRYARYNKEKKRRETWNEAVNRVKEMHLNKYPQIAKEIEWAFDQVKNKRVLGSQRALQFGGKPIERINERIYNCCASYCDRLRFFQETMFLLLAGSGVGFSVQKHHVSQLPGFNSYVLSNKFKENKTFVIPDSIEGWADSLGVLLSSYFENPVFEEYYGYNVIFDYSKIRPKGSYLSSGVGKAPGPEQLKNSLEKIKSLLDRCIANSQRKLRAIDAYDIVMHASDAVLSGGIRRSATLTIFSPDDEEMLNAKIGNWFYENPQRGRSNNSALLLRNETTHEQFLKIANSTRQYGEPGFIFSESTECLFNPCVTKDTVITTTDGLKLVEDLIGKPFTAVVDGIEYPSTKKGFWKTGEKEVLKVSFASGRELRLTSDHKILTSKGWKEVKDIDSKDEVVIHDHRQFSHEIDYEGEDYSKGYCLGNLLSDGNRLQKSSVQMKWWGKDKSFYRKDALNLLEKAKWLSNHHKFENNSHSPCAIISSTKLKEFADKRECFEGGKTLTKKCLKGNWSYLVGLVAGYFDGDGTINHNYTKGNNLRITSISLENLKNIQIILNAFGIYSKIYFDRYKKCRRLMPDGKGGKKYYNCKKTHELCISKDNIWKFYEIFKIRNIDKLNKLQNIVKDNKRQPYKTKFIDHIVSKECIGIKEVYDCTIPKVHAFDANGVYVHNCVEVSFYAKDKNGNSGFNFCNLTEINGKKIKTKEDFMLAGKASAIIGTCQAGYTNFPYLGEVSESITRNEALLGCSITGYMENPEILLNPEIQREVAEYIKQVNFEIAQKIGINPAARATCSKPSGTSSCILGTSSGIHPHHAKRYFRNVQTNNMEKPLIYFSSFNPVAVESSVWSANKTDSVITFCIEVEKGAIVKNDLSAIELLKFVKSTQQNWVEYGTRPERNSQPWLRNNVSNTITVKEEEWDDVCNFIYENRQYFAGVSLIPASGDLDYPQAPFVNIHTPKELVNIYGDGVLMASGLIVDGLHAFDNNLWKACDFVLELTPLEESNEQKRDWIRRVKQFADRYLEGDVRKTCYLMKEVSNWKKWCDLNREYKDVDFSLMIEEEDNTKPMEEVACAGGVCSLI